MSKKILPVFLFVAGIVLSNGVFSATFTYLSTQTVEQLNAVLSEERVGFIKSPSFPKGYHLPKKSSAKYEVELYRVEYDSVIPEQRNRSIKAYGLLAIPKNVGKDSLPFLSYQHGTVFGKNEVPSYSFLSDDPIRYFNSFETRLAVAQFAGNGYVVFAADYFGMSISPEHEGYLVKGSQQQACLDMYLSTRDWLTSNKSIKQKDLFLSGWSQGGYVTMAFLEKLEENGIPVTAASTAAAPTDLFASFNSVIYHPRSADAVWLSTIFSLSSFSFENYYQISGIVDELFKPEYVPAMAAIYYRTYQSTDELMKLIVSLSRFDDKTKSYVSDVSMLIKDEYKDPARFAASKFAEIALQSDVYRWHFKTPVQMFYGLADEAVAPRVATVAATYQKAMGNNGVIVPKPVSGANHRATYLTATSKQLHWFGKMATR